MIIEPWDSETTFEKGKFYKTRGGKKVECLHTGISGTEPLLFADDGGKYFTAHPHGIFYSRGQESSYDIISEWREAQNLCAEETAISSDEKRERVISLIQGFGRVAIIAQPRLHREFATFVDGLVTYIRMMMP